MVMALMIRDIKQGTLQNGDVAVKRLFKIRTIKDKMFHREVKSLIMSRHQNIVRFLGYCSFTEEHVLPFEGGTIMVDIQERLLCFEYISNGNLENHLTGATFFLHDVSSSPIHSRRKLK
jgi:coatomer subunit beta'